MNKWTHRWVRLIMLGLHNFVLLYVHKFLFDCLLGNWFVCGWHVSIFIIILIFSLDWLSLLSSVDDWPYFPMCGVLCYDPFLGDLLSPSLALFSSWRNYVLSSYKGGSSFFLDFFLCHHNCLYATFKIFQSSLTAGKVLDNSLWGSFSFEFDLESGCLDSSWVL